jgi:hypothetical protein
VQHCSGPLDERRRSGTYEPKEEGSDARWKISVTKCSASGIVGLVPIVACAQTPVPASPARLTPGGAAAWEGRHASRMWPLEVIRQHAVEDVTAHPIREVMMNRRDVQVDRLERAKRTFHVTEGL